VLAAYIERTDRDDPLSVLQVGEVDPDGAPKGWVRVRVRAATVNQHDVWTMRGALARPSSRTILGTDAAGVTDDGDEVIVHAVLADPDRGGGDETLDPRRTVLADAGHGTLAEEIRVPARNLVPKPAALSWEQAACLPTAWLTAWRMLVTRARVRPGQRLLVQGAGGAVSTAAVMLGAALGLEVVVTSRSNAKLERARELGAQEAIRLGERTTAPVDVVVDSVGEATWRSSVASLRPGGTLVTCGATSGFVGATNLGHLFSRQLNLLGSTMGTLEELGDLARFVAEHDVTPLVDSVEPLDRVDRQFRRLLEGDVFGKLAVSVGDPR
jgi:NADPH:quinone reductase-like Zn-dependent oxidoreductase